MPATATKPRRITKLETPSAVPGYEKELTDQWQYLVPYILTQHFPSTLGTGLEDDARSAANYGLMRATRYWRADYISTKTGCGVQFKTYAVTCMKREVSRCLAFHKKQGERFTMEWGSGCDGDEVTSRDGIDGIEDAAESSMHAEMESAEYARAEIRRRLRRVKPIHAVIFMQYLGGFLRSDGIEMPRLTMRQLGVKYGRRSSYISRIVKKVVEQLGMEELPKYLFEKRHSDPVEFQELLDGENIPDFQLAFCDDDYGVERVAG